MNIIEKITFGILGVILFFTGIFVMVYPHTFVSIGLGVKVFHFIIGCIFLLLSSLLITVALCLEEAVEDTELNRLREKRDVQRSLQKRRYIG